MLYAWKLERNTCHFCEGIGLIVREYIPIDVFLGGDGLCDCSDAIGVDMGTEGQLDENAADLVISIESLDEGDDLVDRS